MRSGFKYFRKLAAESQWRYNRSLAYRPSINRYQPFVRAASFTYAATKHSYDSLCPISGILFRSRGVLMAVYAHTM